jgi:hypothetical protein
MTHLVVDGQRKWAEKEAKLYVSKYFSMIYICGYSYGHSDGNISPQVL